jgi:CubicO group peptidase (beta-lactamase class C family)
MRRNILPLTVLAGIGAVAFLVWSNLIHTSAGMEGAMKHDGLTAANITYGSARGKPEIIAINAKNDFVWPYYSLSKPITAAAALQIVGIGMRIEGATNKQLLQHTGVWDRAVASDPITQHTENRDCTSVPAPERQFEPGERYAYSNLGYCLVSRAIAEETGKPYQESVRELFPETRSMRLDPSLGPAGGWSGTVSDCFKFASRPVPEETRDHPLGRPNDLPYGLGWALGPDFVTHSGSYRSNFAVVVKKGDFVAVGLFDGSPADDASAADDLRTALLNLE